MIDRSFSKTESYELMEPEKEDISSKESDIVALAAALKKIQSYVPTVWVDNSEPSITAERLNNVETGIQRATNLINSAVEVIDNLQEQISSLSRMVFLRRSYAGNIDELTNILGSFWINFVDGSVTGTFPPGLTFGTLLSFYNCHMIIPHETEGTAASKIYWREYANNKWYTWYHT